MGMAGVVRMVKVPRVAVGLARKQAREIKVCGVRGFQSTNHPGQGLGGSREAKEGEEEVGRHQGEPERCINTVTLVGRVGGDPSLRGSRDRPVTVFSLATNQQDPVAQCGRVPA